MTKISTPTARKKLAHRREPYWTPLGEGLSVGIYIGAKGSVWYARVPNLAGKPRWLTTKLQPDSAMTYREACTAATDWAGSVAATLVSTAPTVGAALDAWLADKTATLGDYSANRTVKNWKSMLRRIGAHLGRDTFLSDVTTAACVAFRDLPDGSGKPRSFEACNRDLAQLKATLTFGANHLGYDGDRAWTRAAKHKATVTALQSLDNGGDDIGRILDVDELRAVIAAADTFSPAFADYIRAAFLTLQRPQALRMLDVRDYDAGKRQLTYRRGKNARKRGAITVDLFGNAAALFDRLAEGKGRGAPLLGDDNGDRWPEEFARTRLAKALEIAGIEPEGITPYSLRHSAVTHALEVERLDPTTVAQLADTSLELIVQTYFRRRASLGDGPAL